MTATSISGPRLEFIPDLIRDRRDEEVGTRHSPWLGRPQATDRVSQAFIHIFPEDI